ncbi:MAG: hypothetical protein M1812_000294 [Candelaria pacifica]|nr:MAG: hypothetical protein M1812_000294 [Candelaria pacifica]
MDSSTEPSNYTTPKFGPRTIVPNNPEVCVATYDAHLAIPRSPSTSGSNLSGLTSLSSVSPRQGSPIRNSNGLSKEVPTQVIPSAVACDRGPPAKRRKLTVAEKDQRLREKQEKQKEREVKEAEKAEKKAKLDEEKRAKDEQREDEKRRREIDREQKRQAKEAEKHVKDEEKRRKEEDRQRKEEEKEKKDKAQLRLNTFFKPPSLAKSTATPEELASSTNARGACEMKAFQEESVAKKIPDTSHGDRSSDYFTDFNTFFAKANVQVAAQHRFGKDAQAMELAKEKLDKSIQDGRAVEHGEPQSLINFDMSELCKVPPRRRGIRGRQQLTMKEIITSIHGSGQATADLDSTKQLSRSQQPVNLLKGITMKFLRFREDVRPPYMGTFTKAPPSQSVRTLCRNPHKRSIPQINYDYDSEAEWEEIDPEDGEDLGSEDEEAASEGDEDEMEGFLDDEEAAVNFAASNKRRLVVGNLEPVCTGLCWEDGEGHAQRNESEVSLIQLDLSGYRLEIIKDTIDVPIDPFATSYWQCTNVPQAGQAALSKRESSSMNPPRIPLHVIKRTHAGVNANISPMPLSSVSSGTTIDTDSLVANSSQMVKPTKRLLPAEHVADFKKAIQGSELTKTGLVEVLKKKFPKISKDVIKDSLGLVAHRVGSKESEKVWALLDGT